MVAIIGLPNAGKSSLLNRLLGSKLSIVTAAAQTTRERVVGIDTRGGAQIVFIDTPGLVEPAYLLHHSMLEIALGAIGDADVVVLLLDGTRDFPTLTAEVREGLLLLAHAVARTLSTGLELIGVMHSHTHTTAYPSPTDVDQAPDPGWHYVIVSFRTGVASLRSYRIVDETVEEEAVVVVDG